MIGDLNKRIEIQAPTYTDDGMGGFTADWDNLNFSLIISAGIWPISAKEFIRSMQPGMEISHRIRIRYPRYEIKAQYRIKYKDPIKGFRYFNIISIIDPNERHEWLDIIAKEAA